MQGQLLNSVTGPNHTLPEEVPQDSTFDFSTCLTMKKLTTHDLYSFEKSGVPLIVKVFSPANFQNYKQEVAYLSCLNSAHIVKVVYHRPAIDPSSVLQLDRSHIIVMKNALRGDLGDYLPLYGRMSEKMVRTYFKQIVQALDAAYKMKPSIIHPHLMVSNILLDSEGSTQICGWSQITNKSETAKLQEAVFACGEILLCLSISFMPFYKKDSPTDTFFKFITAESIHKFWTNIEKRMGKVDKKFKLSSDFKNLIEDIFLKRINSFAAILESVWVREGAVCASHELNSLLSENESSKNQKIETNRKLKRSREEMRKEVLHEYQLGGMNRSKGEHQQFIRDYEENVIREDELPLAEHQFCLKLEGMTPNFIIASLKQFLREEKGKISVILCEQFILSNHKVVKKNNYALVELDFELCMLEEEDQPLEAEIVSLKVKLSFVKDNGSILADITVVESNFNQYYTNLALRFLESTIQRRRLGQEKSQGI